MKSKLLYIIYFLLFFLSSCLGSRDTDIIDILTLKGDSDSFNEALANRGFKWTPGYQPSNVWAGNIEGKKYFIEQEITVPGKNYKIQSYYIFRDHLDKNDKYLQKVIFPKIISQFGEPQKITNPNLTDSFKNFFLWTLDDRDIFIAFDYNAKGWNANEFIKVVIE